MYPYLQVDRSALRHNASAIAEYVKTPVIGVIKCDGYGVSLLEAARAWRAVGVSILAVSLPEDVLALRQDGFDGDILMLSPVVDVDDFSNMVSAILPTATQPCGSRKPGWMR